MKVNSVGNNAVLEKIRLDHLGAYDILREAEILKSLKVCHVHGSNMLNYSIIGSPNRPANIDIKAVRLHERMFSNSEIYGKITMENVVANGIIFPQALIHSNLELKEVRGNSIFEDATIKETVSEITLRDTGSISEEVNILPSGNELTIYHDRNTFVPDLKTDREVIYKELKK
jgi:hypothetical protein